jgi:hypothetical protein
MQTEVVYRLVKNNKIVGYEWHINGDVLYSHDGDTFDKSINPIKYDSRERGQQAAGGYYTYEGDIYVMRYNCDYGLRLSRDGNLHDNTARKSLRDWIVWGIDILFFSWLLLMVVQTIINWGVK